MEYAEDTFLCDKCCGEFDGGEITLFAEKVLCKTCLNKYTDVCDECKERILKSEIYSDSNLLICFTCFNNGFVRCCKCHDIIPKDSVFHIDVDSDDDPYCESCHALYEVVIHRYSYKPCPVFSGEGIYYGVELEVDEGGFCPLNASEIIDLANTSKQHLYIKEDPSLARGFEVVSHPMSLDYHCKQFPWRAILHMLKKMGYSSQNNDTCGYHIHVGRDSLGCDVLEQDANIEKILYFFEKHWGSLLTFSRRKLEGVTRWASRFGYSSEPYKILDIAKKEDASRFVCLNLQNTETVEFRIFKGTLNFNAFIATLQFVDVVCRMALCSTIEEVKRMSWDEFTDLIDPWENKELSFYLAEYGLSFATYYVS